MPKTQIIVTISDVSQFARSLRNRLDQDIGHQTLLNAIAQAAGFRNFQHLKVECAAPEVQPIVQRDLDRALAWFSPSGALLGWPGRYRILTLCLWGLWSQLPDRKPMNEFEISRRLDAMAAFKDAAQLRRGLIDARLVERNKDGSAYRRVGRRPGATERAVVATLKARRGRGNAP